MEVIWIRDLIPCDNRGAKWSEGIKALSPTKLAAAQTPLPISCADVVSGRVAQYIIEGLSSRSILAFSAENDRQLTFIINLVTLQFGRQHNRIARILQGIRALHE